ncbi:MAG: acyltransferase [Pseudomonadota bacterium]|nr:acyltransferase [Pseudomonadota bacterium]
MRTEGLATHGRMIFPSLDVVRFLTATLVMIYHLFFWRNGDVPDESHPVGQFWRFGWVGVEIFFTLSGLVIALSAKHSTPRKFLVDRIVRLAPTIWICATITLLVALRFGHADLYRLLNDYLWTIILRPAGNHIDIVYWTLTVEIAFYALVFCVLATGQFRRLVALMTFIGVVSTAYDVVLALSPYLRGPIVDLVVITSKFHASRLLLLRHGCFFALGVLVWSLKDECRPRYCLALIAVCLAGGTMEVWHQARVQIDQVPVLHHSAALPVLAWLVGISAILISRMFKATELQSGISWVGALRFLGLLTFPLYLIHNNVGVQLENYWNQPWAGLVSVIAVTSLAIVVTLIEPPSARSLKHALSARGKTASVGTLPARSG